MRRFMRSRQLCVLVAAVALGAGCSRDPNVVKQKHLESGNKYFDKGRYKEAAIMYRRALTKDKMYAEGYYRLALTELKLGDVQSAVRDLHRTTQLQPDNQDAVTRLIDIYLAAYAVNPQEGKGVRAELEAIEQRLLAKNPASYDGLRVQGYLALMRNDKEAARAAFEQARALQPDKPETVVALTQVLTAEKKYEAADRLATDYLARHKDTLQLYNVMYVSYVARGDRKSAEAILRQKLQNNPHTASVYNDLASYFYQSGNTAAMDTTLQDMVAKPKGNLEFPADVPSGYLMAGDFYQTHGAAEKALVLYRQGLAADADHRTDYQSRIGQLLLSQNQPEQVRPLVDEILRKDPNHVDGLTMRAALSLLTKKKEDAQAAVADLKLVTSAKPEQAVARLNLGRALSAAGNPDEAITQLNEAVRLDPGPNMLPARFSLAELYQSRRPDPDYGRAYQIAGEIVAMDPNSVPGHLLRANAAFYLKRFEPAREDLDAVLRALPDQRDATFQLARLTLAEAAGLLPERDRQAAKGDKLAAVKAEQKAQALYRVAEAQFRRLEEWQDPRGLAGLVEAQAGLGHPEKAVELLKVDLRVHPDKAENYLALGNLYAVQKDWAGALAAYQEVVRRHPEAPEGYVRLGGVYLAQGEFGKAIPPLRKAAELSPKDVGPLLTLANVYEVNGERGKARPLYEKVLQLQSDNAVALNNLAFLLAENDRELDAALTYAQRARQKWPDNREISDTLSLIYLRKQLPDNAMPLLEDLVKQEPGRATFRLHLAEALYQKQRNEQAKRELDAAAKSNPSKDERQKIQELRAKVG